MAEPGPSGTPGDAGPTRPRVSYVITLWLEPSEAAEPPEWRWRVTELGTGEQHHFRRLQDVLAYVSERSGVAPPH